MASVNISLKREAYQRLQLLKRSNESFSDEILRLSKKSTGADLMKFAGIWSDMSKEEERQLEEGAKKARMKMSSILKKWEE